MKEHLIKNLKNTKGITLIALVITIIVLLILAAVSIATLTGQNGILTQATKSKEKTQIASKDELRKLTIIEATTHLEEYEYEDPSGKKITIPEKCAVSQVEGENTLEDGLVIIDANGNEWVWIEVPRILDIYQNAGVDLDVNNINEEQCDIIYEDLSHYASAYRQDGFEDTFYSTEQSSFENADAYNIEKNNMLRSVYKNEGFWIGRYEVGIENSYRNYGEYGQDYTTEHPIEETPVIKADVYPYNYITCSQAQTLSKQFSVKGKTSSLIWGIQWDLTCKFLEKSGVAKAQINSDSIDWGNYLNVSFVITKGETFLHYGEITLRRRLYTNNWKI